MKQCNDCRQLKPLDEFNKSNQNNDGLQYKCRECERVVRRKRTLANPEKAREYQYRHKYGLTLDEVNQYLSLGCGICGTHLDLVIDHCHETGRIRGALCRRCNVAIGQLNDNPTLVSKALEWLTNGGLK
jgi:hypothetical protein